MRGSRVVPGPKTAQGEWLIIMTAECTTFSQYEPVLLFTACFPLQNNYLQQITSHAGEYQKVCPCCQYDLIGQRLITF